jgi:hypothetical protein
VNKFLGAQRKVVYCILVYLTWMEKEAFPSCHVLIYSRMLQTSVNKVRINAFFVLQLVLHTCIFLKKYILPAYKEEWMFEQY